MDGERLRKLAELFFGRDAYFHYPIGRRFIPVAKVPTFAEALIECLLWQKRYCWRYSSNPFRTIRRRTLRLVKKCAQKEAVQTGVPVGPPPVLRGVHPDFARYALARADGRTHAGACWILRWSPWSKLAMAMQRRFNRGLERAGIKRPGRTQEYLRRKDAHTDFIALVKKNIPIV
jgi:hypothetical protein